MSGVVLTDWAEEAGAARRAVVVPLGSAVLVLALVLALATASLAMLVGALSRGSAAPPPTPSPPVPTWIDIPRPVQIYSLEAPELGGATLIYTARRRDIGGGREDSLAFGAFGGDGPALRLRIFRRGETTPAQTPLFAALVRQAAEAGLSVARSGLPDLLTTRFGRFEVADIALSGAEKTPSESCNGFRLVVDAPGLSMTGIACGGHAAALSRANLACLIDRLDVASGGDDRALIEFFAKSELRRDNTCRGTRLAPDQVHAAWLDDKPVTPIRKLRRH